MLNLKSPKGLAPAGSGGPVILAALVLAGAATAATLLWPDAVRFPTRPNAPFVAFGFAWLALGVLFWAASLPIFLGGFRRGELVTRGTFGLCRHPIYASLLCYWLPAVGLILESWPFFIAAALAWVAARLAVRPEEVELERVFGAEWQAYAARTNRFLPLPRRGFGRFLVTVGWVKFALILLYVTALRPLHLGWGATAEERGRPLPGDELVAGAQYRSTHAITINAPAEAVWPWLAQLGWNRGGLYSYEWLENLFGCRMKNADSVIPALQNVQPGDTFRMDPRIPPLQFVIVEPPTALVIADRAAPCGEAANLPHVAWQFIVTPRPDGNSRLIIRWQSVLPPGFLMELFNKTLLEPVSFIMEERMMRGIKQRAERPAAP
jgi:protein-S-isoprenylcysteine O-methyltransferase Ste14